MDGSAPPAARARASRAAARVGGRARDRGPLERTREAIAGPHACDTRPLMPRVPSPTPYALTALLAVGACEDDRSRCLETRRVIAYAEITADGSSAESLMHTMAGEFAGVLTWNGGA